MYVKAEFSENLKKLREEKGISQTELARRVGVNKSLISAFESQNRLPSLHVLSKLSYQFGVSMEFLLGINKNKTVDVSNLSTEQISVVTSVIKQFEKDNNR